MVCALDQVVVRVLLLAESSLCVLSIPAAQPAGGQTLIQWQTLFVVLDISHGVNLDSSLTLLPSYLQATPCLSCGCSSTL